MDIPCKDCKKITGCQHFKRCARWRDWFCGEWQQVRALFEKGSNDDNED